MIRRKRWNTFRPGPVHRNPTPSETSVNDLPRRRTLGAILAGGRSRRFGSAKALEPLAGAPLVRHVARALEPAVDEAVVVTSSDEIAAAAGLLRIPDAIREVGPLGGLHAALRLAGEREIGGALVVGCDTPFLTTPLLRAVAEAAELAGERAVAAEGADGLEPLCAWYPIGLLPTIERRIARGERSLHRLLEEAAAIPLPLAQVARHADPATCFLNLNTREELARAERMHARP